MRLSANHGEHAYGPMYEMNNPIRELTVIRSKTYPSEPKTRGYHSCFSNPPVYTDLMPPSTQLIDISDGPSLTIGPSFSCAACMVRLFCIRNRFHSIQNGEMETLQCAWGIFANGEMNEGYTIAL